MPMQKKKSSNKIPVEGANHTCVSLFSGVIFIVDRVEKEGNYIKKSNKSGKNSKNDVPVTTLVIEPVGIK